MKIQNNLSAKYTTSSNKVSGVIPSFYKRMHEIFKDIIWEMNKIKLKHTTEYTSNTYISGSSKHISCFTDTIFTCIQIQSEKTKYNYNENNVFFKNLKIN